MCLSYLWVVYTMVICGALGQYSPFKTYTGYRLDPSSVRKIYYCDLVIAITEVSEDNTLINCEIVEIEQDDLREELMKNLTSINTPVLLDLDNMLTLMDRCNKLDPRRVTPEIVCRTTHCNNQNIVSNKKKHKIISGVFPGTNYCGKGNLAIMYFDLGSNIELDMCCRTHDFCPSIIVPGATKYGLTNNSKYTRLNCKCDTMFKNCLKKCSGLTENAIGYIYYNIVDNKCFKEINGKTEFVTPESY
ncbi:hypothetical protein ACI65C_001212 [Semiaphis heraclei]